MAIPTLHSLNLKPPLFPLTFTPLSRRLQTIPFRSKLSLYSLNRQPAPSNFLGISTEIPRLLSVRKLGFPVNAESGEGGIKDATDEAEKLARGESTLPDRFRYLTKEAPDPPVRWPWFVASAFLVYAWRAVLFELGNWRRATLAIIGFVGYLLKWVLAIIFHFIGDPITYSIRCLEDAIYTIRAFYSGIVAYTPVPELMTIIMLVSAVLAVGETAVPNCVSSQPYLLTVSGIIGYAAVRGYISEPVFWTLLLGLYCFSLLIKKKDHVSSTMPVAAVLAAVGEPWVRILVMVAFLALAITHHWKKVAEGKEQVDVLTKDKRIPVPLLAAALAIGIRLAAKWAGYRHLTWMIV
ncbi:hypothetical protein HS088_TW06G00163 [Tripterygium wilfordii]|uniref:Embryo defective n=1 Tax=Tripterygium wilfordii TaxID=458696 RepID=A0A7J7DI77_TRIWF|nr:uncharacterized protein LOC119999544 [Tripterygium wilfordii]KAF5745998.1 hypothetical protein HS088_TW06G00163 [Tripterygium wilfordii]